MNVLAIAVPDYLDQVVNKNGINRDIITALNSQFPKAVQQVRELKFPGTGNEKARAIWDFIRDKVRYKKDPAGRQIIKLPSRLIRDIRHGDCKSMALAAASMMANNGFKNVALRYASYNAADETPTHVYAVGEYNGQQFIIDPVYRQFNAEVPFKHKIDYPMEISVLSGPPAPAIKRMLDRKRAGMNQAARLEKLLTKLKPGSLAWNVVSNASGRSKGVVFPRYEQSQLTAYSNLLQARLNKGKLHPFISKLMQLEIAAIRGGAFTGNVTSNYSQSITGIYDEIGILKKLRKSIKKISIKKVFRGLKTVGLQLPRHSFLSLVALNFRGLAKRLSALPESELRQVWVDKFGGKLSVLQSAINTGKKKKPLFGASKKVKAIKGIGYVVDEFGNGIGAAPVAAAAIIAAASPILVAIVNKLRKHGVPEEVDTTGSGESSNFTEAEGMAADQKSSWSDYVTKGLDIVKATGIIPDKPETAQESAVKEALGPSDDHSAEPGGGSGFKLSPVVLIAAAGGAYLLLKKK